jgi:hypothetical protein
LNDINEIFLANWVSDEGSPSQFLPPVCRLMYQITELTLTLDTTSDEGVGSQGDIVFSMLNHLLEVIIILTVNKKEQAERVSSEKMA